MFAIDTRAARNTFVFHSNCLFSASQSDIRIGFVCGCLYLYVCVFVCVNFDVRCPFTNSYLVGVKITEERDKIFLSKNLNAYNYDEANHCCVATLED